MAISRQLWMNAALLGMSAGISVLAMEWGSRLALNPADYLSLEVENDPILGGVPSASTRSGFDEWGFRNPEVPERADVVAVGDSHTYGNTARMKDSWPMVAGELTGLKIYNMGFGGYGPNQYAHLFETKALKLRPRAVVVGLYMGDDFENAFLISYGLKHWERLRAIAAKDVKYDIWEAPTESGFAKGLRVWLSRHSVLYKLVFHGPLAAMVRGQVQIANAASIYPDATVLDIPAKHITEAFLPKGIAKRLNQEDPSVQEGMRITFQLLSEMNQKCRQGGCELMVAVIPTKEMVFAEEFEQSPTVPLADVVAGLLANEKVAREKVFTFLTQEGITAVDTLPALRAGIGNQLYARTAADMHPGANGYRVIATVVADALKQRVR
jgi:hypothetical protein